MAIPAPSSNTSTGNSLTEFFDAIDWGEEPELEVPACDLSNPDICASCT